MAEHVILIVRINSVFVSKTLVGRRSGVIWTAPVSYRSKILGDTQMHNYSESDGCSSGVALAGGKYCRRVSVPTIVMALFMAASISAFAD